MDITVNRVTPVEPPVTSVTVTFTPRQWHDLLQLATLNITLPRIANECLGEKVTWNVTTLLRDLSEAARCAGYRGEKP